MYKEQIDNCFHISDQPNFTPKYLRRHAINRRGLLLRCFDHTVMSGIFHLKHSYNFKTGQNIHLFKKQIINSALEWGCTSCYDVYTNIYYINSINLISLCLSLSLSLSWTFSKTTGHMGTKFGEHILLITGKDLSYFLVV